MSHPALHTRASLVYLHLSHLVVHLDVLRVCEASLVSLVAWVSLLGGLFGVCACYLYHVRTSVVTTDVRTFEQLGEGVKPKIARVQAEADVRNLRKSMHIEMLKQQEAQYGASLAEAAEQGNGERVAALELELAALAQKRQEQEDAVVEAPGTVDSGGEILSRARGVGTPPFPSTVFPTCRSHECSGLEFLFYEDLNVFTLGVSCLYPPRIAVCPRCSRSLFPIRTSSAADNLARTWNIARKKKEAAPVEYAEADDAAPASVVLV